MNFEELQSAWQSSDQGVRPRISFEMVAIEVEQNRRAFDRTIMWRDLREIIVGLIVAAIFIFAALNVRLWSCYVAAASMLWITGFLLIDRWIYKKSEVTGTDTLLSNIQISMGRLEHQIRLLKTVVWWYLLPAFIGVVGVVGEVSWQTMTASGFMQSPQVMVMTGLTDVILLVMIFRLYYWIYRLNQKAITEELEPRLKDLEQLKASLQSAE